MPHFVIHVGPHKTGSTYVQRRLDACYTIFLRQGIFVPTQWRDSALNPSHTGLTRLLASGRYEDLDFDLSSWEKGGYRYVVISSEDLMNTTDEGLAALREKIGKRPLSVVYYVRAWPSLLISGWNEQIVHGGLLTLPEHALNQLRDPGGSTAINITMAVKRLERSFGLSSIKLVSYDSVRAEKQDLFEHFANTFLGGPELVPASEDVANPSFSPNEAELVRALNFLHQRAGNGSDAYIAQAFRDRKSTLNLRPIFSIMENFSRSVEVDDSKRPTVNVLTSNFQQFGKLVVPPAPADRFYAPSVTQLRYVATDYLFLPGAVQQLEKLRCDLLGIKEPTGSLMDKLLRSRP